MSGYLLDTHAAMWYFNGDNALSKNAKEIMLELSNQIYLSVCSAWELAIKVNLGKLKFNGHAARFVHLAETYGFSILPIKTAHLTAYESLPMIHRDPFDRLLVATALAEQLTIITADEDIAKYQVSHIW
jgi:PIN domain nuclease of toxin-antitoxin system